eukprot:c19093_g1_i1.p1 GENE.c19093_g1_i1~~c19093_g1_i1.p1  ORF type:complete len:541 (+),score=108.97 c19093_g1_i1:1278-2900(+)
MNLVGWEWVSKDLSPHLLEYIRAQIISYFIEATSAALTSGQSVNYEELTVHALNAMSLYSDLNCPETTWNVIIGRRFVSCISYERGNLALFKISQKYSQTHMFMCHIFQSFDATLPGPQINNPPKIPNLHHHNPAREFAKGTIPEPRFVLAAPHQAAVPPDDADDCQIEYSRPSRRSLVVPPPSGDSTTPSPHTSLSSLGSTPTRIRFTEAPPNQRESPLLFSPRPNSAQSQRILQRSSATPPLTSQRLRVDVRQLKPANQKRFNSRVIATTSLRDLATQLSIPYERCLAIVIDMLDLAVDKNFPLNAMHILYEHNPDAAAAACDPLAFTLFTRAMNRPMSTDPTTTPSSRQSPQQLNLKSLRRANATDAARVHSPHTLSENAATPTRGLVQLRLTEKSHAKHYGECFQSIDKERGLACADLATLAKTIHADYSKCVALVLKARAGNQHTIDFKEFLNLSQPPRQLKLVPALRRRSTPTTIAFSRKSLDMGSSAPRKHRMSQGEVKANNVKAGFTAPSKVRQRVTRGDLDFNIGGVTSES